MKIKCVKRETPNIISLALLWKARTKEWKNKDILLKIKLLFPCIELHPVGRKS